jgi:hypothetical protein
VSEEEWAMLGEEFKKIGMAQGLKSESVKLALELDRKANMSERAIFEKWLIQLSEYVAQGSRRISFNNYALVLEPVGEKC